LLRARAQIVAGHYAEATRQLESLAKRASNQNDVLYWLAISEAGEGLATQAEATIDALLAREPNHSLGLESKVSLARKRQAWTAAIAAESELRKLRPKSAPDECALGDLYLRSKNLSAAEAPLSRGIDLDPFAFLCHRDLGELDRANGKMSDAIRELNWVVRYFPEADSKAYVSLALAYQSVGKRGDAESTLAKGKRLFPADPLLQKFSLK